MEELQHNRSEHQTQMRNNAPSSGNDALTNKKTDIVKEEYQGPSAVVAALGLGAIETKVALLFGFLGGGSLGLLFPKQVVNWSDRSKAFGKELVRNHQGQEGIINTFKRGAGHTINKTFAGADGATKHTAKFLEWIGAIKDSDKLLKSKSGRTKAFITAAGIPAFFGFIATTIHGAVAGVKSANGGRDQFNRAKKEITNLRAENDALSNELEETTKELAAAKAKHKKESVLQKESANIGAQAASSTHTPKSTVSSSAIAERLEPGASKLQETSR